MKEWIGNHHGLLWAAGGASAALFVASLLVLPFLVVRIRHDYFAHAVRPASLWANHHPFVRVAVLVGKNLAGGVLMIAGIAMLVLPGQGLLTILVGFLLVDFPGKYGLEKWLVSRRRILSAINWLRARGGRAPLEVAECSSDSARR